MSTNHIFSTLSTYSHFPHTNKHQIFNYSIPKPKSTKFNIPSLVVAMASATIYPATVLAAIVSPRKSTQRRTTVKHINGLNSFGGLKAHNNVATLGLPVCSEQSFAKIVSSLKKPSQGSRGGALTSTCNAIAEIFKIASILPGLVLVGVAVGFVLLRIEAIVEEE